MTNAIVLSIPADIRRDAAAHAPDVLSEWTADAEAGYFDSTVEAGSALLIALNTYAEDTDLDPVIVDLVVRLDEWLLTDGPEDEANGAVLGPVYGDFIEA